MNEQSAGHDAGDEDPAEPAARNRILHEQTISCRGYYPTVSSRDGDWSWHPCRVTQGCGRPGCPTVRSRP